MNRYPKDKEEKEMFLDTICETSGNLRDIQDQLFGDDTNSAKFKKLKEEMKSFLADMVKEYKLKKQCADPLSPRSCYICLNEKG